MLHTDIETRVDTTTENTSPPTSHPDSPHQSFAHTDTDIPPELADRVALLKRTINTVASYTRALSLWTGFRLRRVERVSDLVRTLSAVEAKLLDLPTGTRVTFRDGYLVPAIGRPTARIARLTALLYQPALQLDVTGLQRLRSGTVPLGELLPLAQRSNHFTVRLAGNPVAEQPALFSQATLFVAGRAAALVTETTYWWPLLHRSPATRRHAQPPTTP